MCRDIARYTRVGILKPCSAHIVVLVVYDQFDVFASLLQTISEVEAGEASAHADYSDGTALYIANNKSLVSWLLLSKSILRSTHSFKRHFLDLVDFSNMSAVRPGLDSDTWHGSRSSDNLGSKGILLAVDMSISVGVSVRLRSSGGSRGDHDYISNISPLDSGDR